MRKKIALIMICIAAFLGSNAQELANFMQRAPIVSPEIGREKIVTFRFS